MKKSLLVGFSLMSALLLASCSSSTSQSSSKDASKISSLKSEVSSLKAQLSDSSNDDEESSESDDSDSQTTHTGKIGDTMEFETGEKVTVSKVADDASAPVQDMADGEHAVDVTLTVENTKSTLLDFNAQNFDLYDGQKEIAEFNAGSYSGNIPNSIAAGMKATMTIYFGAKNSGPYSVTFGDYTWAQ